MLEHALIVVQESGFRVVNVDVTVIAETPRLSPFRDEMSRALSEVVGAPVSLKATTMEGLGPIGAREALAALAVCLVEENS
jgi:2-C-methyl-D-erythritol 2,4-cyclodiphosphate synthase